MGEKWTRADTIVFDTLLGVSKQTGHKIELADTLNIDSNFIVSKLIWNGAACTMYPVLINFQKMNSEWTYFDDFIGDFHILIT